MKSIKIITFCFLALFAKNSKAQDANTKLSTIAFSVVAPNNVDKLTESQLSKLESKVTDIVTDNGLSASGYNQSFIIQPKFEINDTKQTAGGMQRITITDCSFSLVVKQGSSGTIFSSITKTVQGSGVSKEDAVSNALQQINTTDDAIQEFIEKAKTKIITYYTQNCENLLVKAETQKGLKQYGSSLALLLTIPEEAQGCYTKAQTKAVAYFNEYQKANCDKLVQQAKAFVAANDYTDALITLSQIDPSQPCAKEANVVLKSFGNKIDDDKKKSWGYTFKVLSGEIDIQKASSQAMNNFALAYMSGQSGSKGTIIIK